MGPLEGRRGQGAPFRPPPPGVPGSRRRVDGPRSVLGFRDRRPPRRRELLLRDVPLQSRRPARLPATAVGIAAAGRAVRCLPPRRLPDREAPGLQALHPAQSLPARRARRGALSREIRKEGRTALWIYAPGYIKDAPGLENMEEITGFGFGAGEQPWGPLCHITDFGHPITRGLAEDLSWGTNSKLAPIFHIEDPEARVLGEVVYSQGNCRPGFAVKEFRDWKSVYSAAPNLPAPVLRAVARWSGVHIYSDAGDVLYANRSLLGVHSLSGGARTFKLGRRAATVVDLFTGRTIARETDAIEVVLEPRSTALFALSETPTAGPR
ncbi:MAG: hypothetical protein MZV64_43595 [Ignavibacteriales bacterium]|nr:hypothetical protein [Ignavibacteriales bacterium]